MCRRLTTASLPSPSCSSSTAVAGRRSGRRPARLACPNGDLSDPGCLDPAADQRGFILVYPDGTGAPLAPDVRTWNSGGGDGGWQCVSGYACDQDVDETAYFTDLLADLGSAFRIDGDHLFSTGISNGGSMSQRLACTFAHIAAIAPVAGENQYATLRPCTPAIPVLEIHGTGDPCWAFDGGDASCLDNNPGDKISVAASIDGWIARNGCQPTPTDQALPDVADDGTNTVLHTYQCATARARVLRGLRWRPHLARRLPVPPAQGHRPHLEGLLGQPGDPRLLRRSPLTPPRPLQYAHFIRA